MAVYSGDEDNPDDVTSGVFHDYSPNRYEMIDALLGTGDFTLELLQILDNYELEQLCNEYEV